MCGRRPRAPGPPGRREPGAGRDAVWRLRRSPLVRAALRLGPQGLRRRCSPSSFLVTGLLRVGLRPSGGMERHRLPLRRLPLAGLVLAVGVGFRAAVAAGPGRIAVRFFGRWRVVDLGQVRAVRLGDQGPFGGVRWVCAASAGFSGFGGAGGFRGLWAARADSASVGVRLCRAPAGPGGDGRGGPGGGRGGARTLVFEDVYGGRVEIGRRRPRCRARRRRVIARMRPRPRRRSSTADAGSIALGRRRATVDPDDDDPRSARHGRAGTGDRPPALTLGPMAPDDPSSRVQPARPQTDDPARPPAVNPARTA